MNYPQIPNLLRRTGAAIAAIAGLLIAADSQAAQISLSTGGTCTYSSMSINPSGDFNVTCAGATTAGVAGTFNLSPSTLTISANSSGQVAVVRSVGTSDPVNVTYSVSSSGGSCTAQTNQLLAFGNGTGSMPITIATTGTAGTCTVTLNAVALGSGGTATAPILGTTTQSTITVSAASGGGGGGGNGAGCPATPGDMVTRADSGEFDFGPQGTLTTMTLQSRQIASLPLPDMTSSNSGKMKIGETTGTVGGSYLEIAISKCRGVIDSTLTDGCYLASYTQNYNEVLWFYQLGPYALSSLQSRHLCYAPKLDSSGQPQTWYVNFRWTYSFSSWGFGRYVFTWGGGGY